MARRNRDRHDQLGQLLVQVQRRLSETPLAPVGEMLSSILSDVQRSAAAGGTSSEHVQRTVTYVTGVLESLPANLGDRFMFDAWLVLTLAAECSQGSIQLSRMLVPKPSQKWGHETIWMPSEDGRPAHRMDVIHFPGDDSVADIDLLDYAFVCHEIGHNILFRAGDAFVTAFARELDAVVAEMQRQTLGIRGSAKQVADRTTHQLRRYWTPTANHHNWAHEIAIDVISLWLCGPAYLAALQDVLEHDDLDPHQLGQSHPPYEIRATALIQAAGQLGWAYYTGTIQALEDRWSSATPADGRSNVHVACADPRLVSGVISAAMQLCRDVSLPCCTPTRIAALEKGQSDGEAPELATDLIIAAWQVRSQSTEAAYEEWERAVISRILADIKG